MLVTEALASKTSCCGPEGCGSVPIAQYVGGENRRYCIGSKCMAWRWGPLLTDRALKRGEVREVQALQGYCGYAGKPRP